MDASKAAHRLKSNSEDSMAIIKPFQNSSESAPLDDLTIENGEDRIAIYGSLNITRDKQGLKLAQELKALLDDTVKLLSSEKLPDHIQIKPADRVDNPFK
jgi:hypothetical protein